MDEPYNYYQHSHCVAIYFDGVDSHMRCFDNRNKDYEQEKEDYYEYNRERACILYDKFTTMVREWGDQALKKINTPYCLFVDNFMNEMRRINLNNNAVLDSKDALLLQALADFLCLQVNKAAMRLGVKDKPYLDFHFVFLVPPEWEYEIREDLIRPAFIRAKLISEDDHNNRLLFFTKLESIFQLVQHKHNGSVELKKGKQYLTCNLKLTKEKLSLDLNAFEAEYSTSISRDAAFIPRLSQTGCLTIYFYEVRCRLVEFLKNFVSSGSDPLDYDNAYYDQAEALIKEYLFYEGKKRKGDSIRKIGSTSADKMIHEAIFATIKEDIKNLVRNVLRENFAKMRTVILVVEENQGYNYFRDNTEFDPSLDVSHFFCQWCMNIIQKYELQFNYRITTFEHQRRYLSIGWDGSLMGAKLKMVEVITSSDTLIPPYFAQRNNSLNLDSLLSRTMQILIKIDISFKSTRYSCVKLYHKQSVEEIFNDKHDEFNRLYPLENFFIQSELTSPVNLCIKNRMLRLMMEDNFNNALAFFTKFDRKAEKRMNMLARIIQMAEKKIEELYFKEQVVDFNLLEDFLSEQKEMVMPSLKAIFNEDSPPANGEEDLILTQQQKYMKVFLMLYLGYVNELIFDQPFKHYDYNFKKREIGYVISVEKKLLDDIIGTKEDLRELLFASGIIKTTQYFSRAHIITHGEGLLPVIQNRLNLNLPLKTYYVLAQLHEDYLQLTLHQVVKISSSIEDAADIIINDKIIPIENVQDSVCKNIWNNITIGGNLSIECCDIHSYNEEVVQPIYLFKSYKQFIAKIKKQVFENFASTMSNIAIDVKEKVGISSNCACSIHLSARDIFNISLEPTIQDIASVITAALVNSDLFGGYTTTHLFMFGDFMNFIYDSPFHKTLAGMFQEAVNISIESREIGTQGFVILESYSRLLQPAIDECPFLHNSLKYGNIQQVSRETYGLNINAVSSHDIGSQKNTSFSFKSDGPNSSINVDSDHAVVILQRGQTITNAGISRTIYLHLEKGFHTGFVSIRFIRLINRNLHDSDCEEIISLGDYFYQTVKSLKLPFHVKRYKDIFKLPLTIRMKPVNNSSSLEFSVNFFDTSLGFPGSEIITEYARVGEQLTVAYS